MRLLFMTGNRGKLAEAQHYFAPLGFTVEQLLINGEPPFVLEPQADSLKQVAKVKIEQGIALLSKHTISGALLVEDAGLFIDSLDGFPGVYSASTLDKIELEGILKLLGNQSERGAEFRACAALWNGEEIHYGHGICRGEIASEKKGDSGFGYDPIFIPNDVEDNTSNGLTFGQMTTDEKQQFSHRKKAMAQLIDAISTAN